MLTGVVPRGLGQGSQADYERAEMLAAKTRGTVFKDRVRAHWLADGRRFWYRNELPGGLREYRLVEAATGERRPVFDHARLADALSKHTGREIQADRLELDGLELAPGDVSLTFRMGGTWFHCDLGTFAVEEVTRGQAEKSASAPTTTARASRRTGEETELTFVNLLAEPIELLWLDSEGRRHSYGTLASGAERRQHTFGGHIWIAVTREGRELLRIEAPDVGGRIEIEDQPRADGPSNSEQRSRRDRGESRGRSPDGRWEALIRDHNVVLRDVESGEDVSLSDDGTADDPYRPRFHWSPDSNRLVAIRERPAQEHMVHLVASSPRDQLQPQLQSFNYLKPGDRIAHPRPVLFDVPGRKPIPIADDLFPTPWSLTEYHWAPDSSRFSFLYNQRGHQVLRIVEVDAHTGETRAVVDERSPTFLDYAHKTFLQHLDDTQDLIWMSERSGWNHLYLIDARTGVVKNPITQGNWVVRQVDRVDPEARQVWFRAMGIHPEQDPYHLHFARVNFDGTGLTLLTDGDGTHDIQFSPDGRFLIDVYSRVDSPPITELRRADDGSRVCVLEEADWSALLATGWRAPERFSAPGRDGTTEIHGVIYRPTTFDEAKTYPVIEQIYAGPQSAFVPKRFSAFHRPQALAELGFIVVQIDGMGTNWRSKAFHDVCWRNLKDAGFPDRVAWLKAAAEKYSQLDLSRVGLYGGSAGGQNALGGLLFHGDFYKVGVADCGCHDNRMDKIWWNELWMGWPIGSHYEENSNVAHAHKLRGKLLLMVGELDRNVDPASTMQVVNALIKANRDFELIVFPGAGHGAGSSPYGQRRMRDFFVRHLLGVEPRHQ
jgi:dipeptidyl aminopeptidase/acylaminoacyl peptidase